MEQIGRLVENAIEVATRWRLVNVDTGLLFAAAINAGKLRVVPPQVAPVATIKADSISLNLFDDVQVSDLDLELEDAPFAIQAQGVLRILTSWFSSVLGAPMIRKSILVCIPSSFAQPLKVQVFATDRYGTAS